MHKDEWRRGARVGAFTRLSFRVIFLLSVVAGLLPSTSRPVGAQCTSIGTWELVSTLRPISRSDHSVIYDPSEDRMIIFGGERDSADVEIRLHDVWAFDLINKTWDRLDPQTSVRPLRREGHSAVLDSEGRMIVFGGRTDVAFNPPTFGFLNDVWSFDLGSLTWSNVHALDCTPPGGINYPVCRWYHGAVTDPSGSTMWMFGGDYEIQTASSFYEYSLDDDSWTFISDGGGAIVRSNHTVIHDSPRNRLVTFAGFMGSSEELSYLNDTWTYNLLTEAWSQASPTGTAPAAREDHAAVYDANRQRMVVFGGLGGTLPNPVLFSDLWTLSFTPTLSWSQVTATGTGPSARQEHTAIYDSERNQIVIFGGEDAAGNYTDETWILHLDVTPPAQVTDLAPAVVQPTSIWLSWTAPGDDGSTGTACEYDLRVSQQLITESNFLQATRKTTPAPLEAGNEELVQASGLQQCTNYYFALKTRDDAGLWSPMSNVVLRKTGCIGGGAPTAEHVLTGGLGVPTPMPASRFVTLRYSVPRTAEGQSLKLEVFDLAGRRVRTIHQDRAVAGEHEIGWDLRAESGERVPSGVYYARLQMGTEQFNRSLVVVER
ncbi:MAG: Kelch repeat-containing protein [Candidatus Eiseniibacteriota bacterium]